ncbi:MAG: branched-chain amino acid ABC transporter permease [bacterium]|nr:branched-chain amino acid ABC transporter permease [bacterium]
MTSLTEQMGLSTWLGQKRVKLGLIIMAVILALIYPYVSSLYFLSLAIEVFIFAIFAMSLDLLLGYTGLASFGHAAFLGLGGYILGYISSRSDLALNLTSNILITLPLVIIGTALIAFIIGFFALRTSGIYFLMVTLAFAQMLFSIAIRWSGITGGSDGLAGVARPVIGLGSFSYEFSSRPSFYYLVLFFFLLSWWLLRRIVNSPFGWTLRGIRENEQRMKALGYNTFRFKMAAFVIAGTFAGLSGMLLVQFFRHAAPGNLYWTMSGQVIVMLIVGGTGTLIGPILGAMVIRLFPLFVSSYTERWELLLGLLFILFVLFAPKGIMGFLGVKPSTLLTQEKRPSG